MPVILFIGTTPFDLDPTEGNTISESAGALVGVSVTSATIQLVDVTQNDPDGNGILDDNDLGAGNTQEYDLGAGPVTSVLDSTQLYTIDITQGNGTVTSGSVIVLQNENGDIFVEELSSDAGLLDNINIQSITFTSLVDADVVDALPNPEILNTNVVCFSAGTKIKTPSGNVSVETLKAGDTISTLDHGDCPLRWVYSHKFDARDLTSKPKLRPVRIMAGALGNNLPEHDLLLSRQHRVLVNSKVAERLFGSSEVLISAIKLTEFPGIFIDDNVTEIEYFHLLFDQHEIIFAEGAPAESLHTGTEALTAIDSEAREEILTIFPEIADIDYLPDTVRIIPSGRLQKKLVSRHIKNGHPLFHKTRMQDWK